LDAGLKRTLVRTLTFSLSVVAALLVLEVLYRSQLVDTYQPELRALNSPLVLASGKKPTILVMGDSFTARRDSYAAMLRDTLQDWRVVNSAVSGTGVLQALSMAPRRFDRFEPSIFVYQVYVGNDLFDIRYPVNWRSVSAARNLYWLLANHLRVVGYMNYRLGQLREPATTSPNAPPGAAATTETAEAFAVERYDPRVKAYLRAEPSLLEDSILVQEGRQHDYAVFLDRLSRLLAYCRPEECRAYVLVVPHASQVDERYVTEMTRLGARFTNPALLRTLEYPFLVHLRERFGGSSNVRVVNPLGRLREAQARQAVFNANDEHLNPAGQREIAAIIRQEILPGGSQPSAPRPY